MTPRGEAAEREAGIKVWCIYGGIYSLINAASTPQEKQTKAELNTLLPVCSTQTVTSYSCLNLTNNEGNQSEAEQGDGEKVMLVKQLKQ